MKSLRLCVLSLLLGATSAVAFTIQIDYSYDTDNFFNTPEKREAMEAVAGFFEEVLADNLLRIDPSEFPSASWTARFTHPSTGGQESIVDLVVPEDTLIIYVGARALQEQVSGQGGPGAFSASGFQSWFDRVRGRGNPGALGPDIEQTDFAPWGGSMTFNSSVSWNFSLTENQPGREFVTVALHEMMHVLGIGTAPSWNNLRSGGKFNGPAAVQSFGSAPDADSGHLLDADSTLFGSFGATHGQMRPALMLPVWIDTGTNFDVATDLDLAVLEDIGWQIRPREPMETKALSPARAEFEWQSVSFLDYRVERSTDLVDFPGGSGTLPGNGQMLDWSDPAPPTGRAFYRLAAEPNTPQPSSEPVADAVAEPIDDDRQIHVIEVEYPFITDCGCGGG